MYCAYIPDSTVAKFHILISAVRMALQGCGISLNSGVDEDRRAPNIINEYERFADCLADCVRFPEGVMQNIYVWLDLARDGWQNSTTCSRLSVKGALLTLKCGEARTLVLTELSVWSRDFKVRLRVYVR